MKISRTQAITTMNFLVADRFVNDVNKYAASRNVKRVKKNGEDVDEFTQEKRLQYCFKDKDQCPVKNDKGAFKFTEANEKAFTKDLKEYMAEEVDFEPYVFKNNNETAGMKYIFINSDLEFLLDESLLEEPKETAEKTT